MCTWSSHRVSGNNQQGNWEAFVGCTEDIEKVLATVDFVKNCPRARLWGGIQRVQRRCRGLREKYSGVLHGNSRKFARVENDFSLLARRSPTRKLPKICKSRKQLFLVGKAAYLEEKHHQNVSRARSSGKFSRQISKNKKCSTGPNISFTPFQDSAGTGTDSVANLITPQKGVISYPNINR